MNYPNGKNLEYKKEISYANRGMDLENILNDTNLYLREKDIAYIYKKPTPIGVVKIDYENNKQVITKAYFKEQSTLDYNGLYNGKYIEFDAKETKSKTSFPLSNVHPHQIKHIENILNHGGIIFLIISMNNNYYLLPGNTFLKFINENERKSIPYEFIEKNSYKLEYNYLKGLNYIDYIKNMEELK